MFIFDCDGVIWKGDTVLFRSLGRARMRVLRHTLCISRSCPTDYQHSCPALTTSPLPFLSLSLSTLLSQLIDGVPAILDKLRAAGKKCFFVTNNSTKSRKGYKGKFDSLGLNVQPEEIFSSSFAAAAYLEQIRFRDTGKKVYILGERGIQEELDLIGVPWIGGEGDATKTITLTTGYALPHDHNVGAVIVGFDRFINYYKIQYAQLCINENPGCQAHTFSKVLSTVPSSLACTRALTFENAGASLLPRTSTLSRT